MALVPLVFGLLLQLRAWLTWRPLWLDEQMIARNLRDRDFAGLATVLDYNQAAPIGWLWTQRAVVEVAGTGERTLRLVPFLFAAGSLILAWLAVRRMLGPVGSFTTVTLFAVNAYLLRYAVEVKPYSGDVFWVLLMIVLAWWTLAAPARPRRFVVWWSVAALASLFSMGAVLAMPGLALVLVGVAWWWGRPRAGWRSVWRAVWRAGLPGLIWLAAFVPQYLLSMRELRANQVMSEFWAKRGYPPVNAGASATVEWTVDRLRVLAGEPFSLNAANLGREWLSFAAVVFWSLALLGVLVAGRGGVRSERGGGGTSATREPAGPHPPTVATGLLLAAPVVSGFVLAVLWVSPLYMRLAMWIMPGLFLAVGFAVDAAARLVVRGAWGRVRWPRWAGGLVGAATTLAAAVVFAPLPIAAARPPAPSRFDYRGAVQWLVAQHRPGDLVLGVNGGGHALGWYDPTARLSPVTWVKAGDKPCDMATLRRRLAEARRVLFYADLRNEVSVRSAETTTSLLAELGEVVAEPDFGSRGIVSVTAPRPGRTSLDGADGSRPSTELPGKSEPCLLIVK